MKIARTFTIDYHLYQELRKKPNQSRIVESSIRRYLSGDEDFDIKDVSTKRLLAVLLSREDIPDHLTLLIKQELHLTE